MYISKYVGKFENDGDLSNFGSIPILAGWLNLASSSLCNDEKNCYKVGEVANKWGIKDDSWIKPE